ncbi:MAG TPA: CHAD domain-containing protein [Pyrinomonadaceae bacterium]|nr:CHAD domain-containing protein [Pyrinomonadaceae bacterium]
MSYQLRDDESLGEALQRICRKQVQLALAFARGEKETDDTPVHETRKHLKKARAALQLLKKEIGRGLFRKEDHCLRDVGRLISEIRDAEVRLQTVQQLQGLAGNQKHRKYRKLEEMLLIELENFVVAFAEWHVQAIPMLESMCKEIDSWPVEHFDRKQLLRAVQRSYKCGRQALADAKARGTTECFHEFRSAAKQLWYQLRIIRPINPVVLGNLGAEVRSLGSLLGRAHDLSFLGDRLRQEQNQSQFKRESHELLAVIEASVSDLQRGAADLAERFFAERPRDFGKRIAAWLDDWPDGASPSMAEELVNDSGPPVPNVA